MTQPTFDERLAILEAKVAENQRRIAALERIHVVPDGHTRRCAHCGAGIADEEPASDFDADEYIPY